MKIRHATKDDLQAISYVETSCFPRAEAASESSIAKRIEAFGNHFWLIEEEEELICVINGMTTDNPILQDCMYQNASMHNENGAWQMIFGVATKPTKQHKGHATTLMQRVIEDCREQKRSGIVLTCKRELIPFYEKLGFMNEGLSNSKHGGVKWSEMRLIL